MSIIVSFRQFAVSHGYYAMSTADAYISDIRSFQSWGIKHGKLACWHQVNTLLIEDYIADLVSEGVEFTTINRKISALSAFFGFLCDKFGMVTNPCSSVSRLKATRREREAISLDAIRNVLSSISVSLECKALICLICESGLRIGECMALRQSDIDFERKEIHLLGKGRVQRVVYFGDMAALLLKQLIANRHNDCLLFPKSRRDYNYMVHCALAPLLGKQRVSPHVLRHTFATESLCSGMPLEELQMALGHKNLSTTLLYTHCRSERNRYVNNKFAPRL